MIVTLLLAFGLHAPGAALPQDEVTPDPPLGEWLSAAVDLPDPEDRAAEARRLGGLKGPTLEDWLSAAEEFQPLGGGVAEPGQQEFEVDLWVSGDLERTTLTVVVPASYDPGVPAPLLVALHGAGGDGPSMVWPWAETAEALGAVLLAPTEAGPNIGFQATVRERESVLAAVRWARRHYQIDENRVWLTGYSRGAHLCWDLALRHPDVFAAAVACAGAPRFALAGGAANLRYAENLGGLRVRGLIGEHDDPGLLFNTRQLWSRLGEPEPETFELRVLEERGHELRVEAFDDWTEWYGASVREPWPTEVVRRAARPGETRRRWVEIQGFREDVEEVFEATIRVARGKRATQDEMRAAIIDQAEERTARVHAEFVKPGSIKLEPEEALAVRILLRADWLPERGKFKVRDGRKWRSVEVEPDAGVLLREFVESFDRAFLPVAEIELSVPR